MGMNNLTNHRMSNNAQVTTVPQHDAVYSLEKFGYFVIIVRLTTEASEYLSNKQKM